MATEIRTVAPNPRRDRASIDPLPEARVCSPSAIAAPAALVNRRILVVTDLGAAGGVAVRAAAAQARATGGALALVHALPRRDRARPWFAHGAADARLRATLPRMAGMALGEEAAGCAAGLPEPEQFVGNGSPALVALATAERWGADLIVVGAPEAGAEEVERIVRHAAVPVLIARREPAGGPIVACTDFSDPALPAIRAAAAVAHASGDDLHVLHAMEPLPCGAYGIDVGTFDCWPERRAAAERRLVQAVTSFGPARYVLVEGPIAPSLIRATRALGARLLVIGTVGRSGLGRLLLGSMAETLIRISTCSTLVVRLHRGGARALRR